MNRHPLFHSLTACELTACAARLPHSVLLYGSAGVGLETAAVWLARQAKAVTLIVQPECNEKVNQERGRITVEVIRRLYDQTRAKYTQRLCVIITQADTMTTEAQHAFLKLLEEPGDGVTFIIICHDTQVLLPTVRSRLQTIQIRRIDRAQSEALLTSLGVTDDRTRTQLLFIAEGLPGMLTRLVTSPDMFQQEADILRQARAMISGTGYQRLVHIHELKDSRVRALAVVTYTIRLVKRELVTKQAASSASLRLLEKLEAAYADLQANGNIRLVLAAAMV